MAQDLQHSVERESSGSNRPCSCCKRDIQCNETFFECKYCRLQFCTSCKISHPPGHEYAIIMLNSDTTPFEVSSHTEICEKCSKAAFFRYSCQLCDYAVCHGCWFDQTINFHVHRTYRVIELKRSVPEKRSMDDCCTNASVNHCHNCLAPFSIGQELVFCQTCYAQTNEAVYQCHGCAGLHQHHKLLRWTFEVTQSHSAAGIHCKDCGQKINSSQELKQHPHSNYTDVYLEEHLNQVISRSYRQCRNKAVRTDYIPACAMDQCCMCHHETSSLSVLRCQQCSQDLKLCVHCKQNTTRLHVHLAPTYNPPTVNTFAVGQPDVLRSSSLPSHQSHGMYQPSKQAQGTYRSQSYSSSLSQSPVSLPYQSPNQGQGMYGSQPHRPSLSQNSSQNRQPPNMADVVSNASNNSIRSPSTISADDSILTPKSPSFGPPSATNNSIQTRAIQPTQKKRTSIAGGLMKAYNVTQKNPLAKLATKVVVSNVTNAVFGQDMSDSFGGFDIGDTGGIDMSGGTSIDVDPSIFDSGTVDSGIVSSPDVIVVDPGFGDGGGNGYFDQGGQLEPQQALNNSMAVTDMMQQETWQSVTLPQTAAWAGDPSMMNVG